MATPIAIAVSLVHKSRTARACLAAAPLDCYASLEPDPASILQGGEMIYYEGLAHARRKMSYLVGRYTAKQAVSAYLGVRPDALELVPGFFGQPVVTASAVQPPAVSLSHDSRTAVAIAFPEAYLIGLDIETLDSCGAGAVESVLSEREFRAATVGPFAAPVMRTVFWTAREALGKAIRCGCLSSRRYWKSRSRLLRRRWGKVASARCSPTSPRSDATRGSSMTRWYLS